MSRTSPKQRHAQPVLASGNEDQFVTKEGFGPGFTGVLLQICATCENPAEDKQSETGNIAGKRRQPLKKTLAGGMVKNEGQQRYSIEERVKEKTPL